MEKLKNFLLWLVTPQEGESISECVDEYCEVVNNIHRYSEEELKELINDYLSIYGITLEQ